MSIYYQIFIDRYSDFLEHTILVGLCLVLIIGFNYYIFYHQNQWKKIVVDYDKLPKLKNRIGGWLVLFFIAFVIASLVFAFHLMSKIDWVKYH